MKATIQPARLQGQVTVVPSKSQAHRMLICAALADRPTRIRCSARSRDIDATADCLRALGAEITYLDQDFVVTPVTRAAVRARLCCGESGSTLRFLLPVAAALGTESTFCLAGRLPERPLSPLWEELCAHGCRLSRPADDQILLEGKLTRPDFTMAADVSSQFISGLLFALPLLGGGRIRLTGQVESAGYLAMTCQAMTQFGIEVSRTEDGFRVAPGGYRSPGQVYVEGDWSGGAFWLCAQALGQDITCLGLSPDSAQADRRVGEAIRQIRSGSAEISARDIPDLVPVLAVLAAATPGTTRFTDAQRLRIRESDRIESTLTLIRALGGTGSATDDGMVIQGRYPLRGGCCDSANDHRIAMSAAVAALACTEPVILTGAQAVEKSYPTFWQEYERLGGRVRLEEDV